MFSPPQLATYFVISATAAIFCVLAIWAASSRRHWFFRALVPLAALAALLPIQAHEPLIYFAMVMAEIAALIFVGRWLVRLWQSRPPLFLNWNLGDAWTRRLSRLAEVLPTFAKMARAMFRNEHRQETVPGHSSRWIRFGLRDLLMAMVPVGIAAWIVSQFAGVGLLIFWPDALYASLLLAVIGLMAYGVFASRWKWLFSLLLIFAVGRAVSVDAFELVDWLWSGELTGAQKSLAMIGFSRPSAFVLPLLWLYAETALLILAGLGIMAIAGSRERRPVWRVLAGGILLPPAALLAWTYWQMVGIAEIPITPPDQENVYPQVVALAVRLENAGPGGAATILQESLVLLDHPGRVAVNWSLVASDPASVDRIPELAQLRNLSRALEAEAENLHLAGRHDQALRYELATLKLGALQLRSGLMIHALVGIAVEGVGTSLLARHRTQYSTQGTQQIIAELAKIALERDSLAAIMARDAAFGNVAWRWRTRLQWAIDRLVYGAEGRLVAAQRDLVRDVFRRQQASEQLLLADLAIQLFQKDHGQPPQTLDELVPDYVPAVPSDPYTDRPLVYRLEDRDYQVYSIGQDGQDNGGRTGTWRELMGRGFDLTIDTLGK